MSGTAWSDSANGSPAGHSSGSSTSTTVATRRTVRTAAYRSSPAPQVTPCYTCRRRRLKCDGARPKCHRCGEESVECLGYKKPLKWVKGVAARGKLMGKNFDEVGSSNEEAGADRDGMRDGKVLARRKGSPGMTVSVEVAGPMHGLVDPVFQDLDSDCRFYISFCKSHFPGILAVQKDVLTSLAYRRRTAVLQDTGPSRQSLRQLLPHVYPPSPFFANTPHHHHLRRCLLLQPRRAAGTAFRLQLYRLVHCARLRHRGRHSFVPCISPS